MGTKLLISLDQRPGLSRSESLASGIRQAIADGRLADGLRLPSVRDLAKEVGVSVATVRAAMGALADEGLIEVRHGSGTYVTEAAALRLSRLSGGISNERTSAGGPGATCLELEGVGPHEPTGAPPPGRWARRMQSSFAQTRLHARYDEAIPIDLRVGAPPSDDRGNRWTDALELSLAEAVTADRAVGDPQGLPALRERICSWLRATRSVECSAADIFIVSGGQQARNLVTRLLVGEGTRVAVEDPGSIFARLMFSSCGADLVPVGIDDSGMILDELERLKDISVVYLAPSAQFPTGAVLSAARRRRLAEWALPSDIWIIEDDNNSEFSYESRSVPALHSYGCAERTIYIGTFSQALLPSLRLGYVVVPPALANPMYRLKWLSDRGTSTITQTFLLRLFTEGLFAKHMRKSHALCSQRRETLIEALSAVTPGLFQFTPVKGGLHQTVWLPAEVDDLSVFELCFARGLGVLPVSGCYLRQPARPGIMINFSNVDPEVLKDGVRILAEVLEATHGP